MNIVQWQDWVGHFSYLMLAVSYLVTNMYWLRALAIVALGLEGVYFFFSGDTPLWVGIDWAAVFVGINAVQLLIMARNRMRVRLSSEERGLHRQRFGKLDRVDFDRLVRAGQWRDVAAATVLAREGERVESVYLLLGGAARVESGGRVIAIVQPGSFIGEMSFLSGEPAAATVTTQAACRVFAVPQDRLHDLLRRHDAIRAALQELFGTIWCRSCGSSRTPPHDGGAATSTGVGARFARPPSVPTATPAATSASAPGKVG